MPNLYGKTMEAYLEHLWKTDPVSATRQGIHKYDHLLTDFSVNNRAEKERFLSVFQGISRETLSCEDKLDYPFVLAALDLQLNHPELQRWGRGLNSPTRNPQMYAEMVSNALFPLMIGEFSPVEARMASILARLELMPEMLADAKRMLTPDTPPVWVEMALTTVAGAQKFLQTAVKPFASQVPAMQTKVEAAIANVLSALADYAAFLKDELGPKACGNFAIGEDNFNYLLKRYHMVDMDCQDLYQFGLDEVARYTSGMLEVAQSMGYGDNWVAAIEEVKNEFPPDADWVKVYDEEVELAKQFVMEQNLVTVPPEGECPCEWMPVFMRDFAPIALPWSSPMFDPGYKGKWHITPLDEEASSESQRQHLRDNSYAWIRNISHHEIFPGHYMQALIVKLKGTNFRKVFSSPVYVEGWSMYWEEYLREVGFLATPKLYLMQLRLALWRAVRIVVDTGLHTRNMTMDEAVRYLVETARLEPRWAQSQIKGYTTSPTYQSCYLLGKKEVYDLKRDYRNLKGASFSEKDFHDTFLSYGSLPVALVREAMLKGVCAK